ncbi:hypothetical protein [Streptomyces niger]|uniref:hypothetical protein n=1 Tax=Streptomyces niger TaxID=66373 RepID=UPI00069996BD|nr:hypothetical protein [Streptomyces niger]
MPKPPAVPSPPSPHRLHRLHLAGADEDQEPHDDEKPVGADRAATALHGSWMFTTFHDCEGIDVTAFTRPVADEETFSFPVTDHRPITSSPTPQ